jgi:predicted nucleic acid-binding protein
MIADCFLDTNVLVYAALPSPMQTAKRKRAAELIAGTRFGISAQVLQEFYVTVTRKGTRPLKPREAMEWIEQLEIQPCASLDASIVKIAIEYSERYGISYWDGAIIAAAESLGVDTVYSEDLNDGQVYGEVRVRNPFKDCGHGGSHESEHILYDRKAD